MIPEPRPFATTRRDAILGAACLCCLPALAHGASALDEVSPGVFIRRGPDAEASAANLDGIANIGS